MGLLTPAPAAAEYPVEQRLCDVSHENCRTQILDLIKAEPGDGSIDVAFWFMEDVRYSNELVKAKSRGVRVRVLFDTEALSGSEPYFQLRRDIIAQLKNAGIPMRDKSTGGILHWKLMIFGKQGIVNFSAANFSPDGYVPWQDYVNYEDEVVSFETDASLVATFKSKYDDVWTTTTGYANYANVTELVRYHGAAVPQDPRLNFPPTQNYATRVVKAIDQEMAGIEVDMYRITDAKPADAMIRAVQRGVPIVRLYTEPEQYRNESRLWHSYNVDRMWKAGVQVKWRKHEGLNHQKSVILHGQHTVVFGSSNWTTPSANQQLEHNLFTTDNRYYDFFTAQFQRKWNNEHFEGTVRIIETEDFVPKPPDKPVYVSPATGATGVSPNGVLLKWKGGPWAHKYDIYIGTSPNLSEADKVAIDFTREPDENSDYSHTFATPPLQPGTTYYWKIVSKTMADKTATTSAPYPSFTTSGTAPVPADLPAPWATADIGNVAAAGSAGYDSALQRYTLRGSGADIWDSADEFRYVFKDMTGDGTIIARVVNLSNEHAWTKAGVMMRDGLAAGAAHATMFVSAAKGLAFQRRTASGGVSTSTSGGAGVAPRWLKMERVGNTFTASYSTDGSVWTPAGNAVIPMGSTIKVGLALTSHLDGTISTATFSDVSTDGTVTPPPDPPDPPPSTLPANWFHDDVGNATPDGSASYDSATATYTVNGAGADVWGTADALHFAYTTLEGDGEIVARVVSVQNRNAWTKAGVMMRDGMSAGAAQASMFVTPTTVKGTAFQRRPTAGGTSVSTAGPAVAPSYWVKLVRIGSTVTASTSPDNITWTEVDQQTMAFGSTINVGLAISSHVNGTLATATFDSVNVRKY